MEMDTVRRISIIARTEGVEKATAELQRLSGAQDTVGSSSEKTSKANLSVERSFDSLQRRVDVTHRAQQDYERDIRVLSRAHEQGLIPSTARLNELLAQSTQRYNQTTAGIKTFGVQTGLARYELINLGRQAQDIGVSLASGQSFGTVLVQQGAQIADVFTSSQGTMAGFWNQIKTGAAAVFTPLRLVGGAVAGLGIAGITAAVQFASAQTDIERSLLGVGRASGATVTDINRIGQSASSAFGLSVSEAKDFATQLAATGRVGVDQLENITKVGRDLSLILGVNASEAAKKLADAFASPSQGAQSLNQRLGSFSASDLARISSLEQQNRLQEAQALLLDRTKAGLEGINATISTGSSLWTAMGNAASNSWNWLGEVTAQILRLKQASPADQLKSQIDQSQKSVDDLLRRLERMSSTGYAPGRTAIERQLEVEQGKVDELTQKYNALTESQRRAADAQALNYRSQQARAQVTAASPDLSDLLRARDLSEGLAKTFADINKQISETGSSPLLDRMGIKLQEVQEAAERAKNAFETMQTPTERLTAEYQVQLQTIMAKTNEERIAAAIAEQQQQLAGQAVSNEEAKLAVQQRANIVAAQLYETNQETVRSLQQQAELAGARNRSEEISVRAEQTRANLLRQGATAAQAEEGARAQRDADEAAANRAVKEQTIGIQQQTEMIYAQLTGQEAQVAAAQAYENAIRSGADSLHAAALEQAVINKYLAEMIVQEERASQAAMERANQEERVAEAMANQAAQQRENAALQQRISMLPTNGTPGPVFGSVTYPVDSGGIFDKIAGSGNYQQYVTSYGVGYPRLGAYTFSEGAASFRSDLGNTYLQDEIAKRIIQGMDPSEIAKAVSSGLIQRPESAQEKMLEMMFGLPKAQADANTTFRALLDLYKRAGTAPSDVLAKIQSGELGQGVGYQDLLQAMDELRQSVDSNTNAQRDILSQLYTTDPRISHLGFRAGSSPISYDPFAAAAPTLDVYGNPAGTGASVASNGMAQIGVGISGTTSVSSRLGNTHLLAAGGIMTEDGLVPLRSYATGGVAYSPQAAIFGEGSSPEAFIPLQSGAVPVKFRGDGQRPVQIVNNFYIERDVDPDTTDQIGFTLYQQQQRLSQMIGR